MIPAWVNGKLTPVEKLEAHLRGLRHMAVSVFLIRDGQTLIQKRAAGKYHTPGLWANTCCTHPHWREPAEDCARRRMVEELGIDGIDLTFADTVEYRADVGGGLIEHEVVDIFRATSQEPVSPRLNRDEVSDVAWIGLDRLSEEIQRRPERFTPWLRIYMTEHRDEILGLARAC